MKNDNICYFIPEGNYINYLAIILTVYKIDSKQ